MKRRADYRDVWVLGPPTNGYPGGFPAGLVNRIRRRWWGTHRLWVCSGGFHDPEGVTLDIKSSVRPSVCGNAECLPFRDDSFDFVMADPPYSDAEAEELYGLERTVSSIALLNEMHRVCRPEGLVLLLHRIVPMKDPRVPRMDLLGIVGVVPHGNLPNIRALTVWRKPAPLEVFA